MNSGGEFPRGGRRDVDALGGDELAGREVEAGPGFGHAAEAHLLDRLAGGGVHNRRGDSHAAPVAVGPLGCPAGGTKKEGARSALSHAWSGPADRKSTRLNSSH